MRSAIRSSSCSCIEGSEQEHPSHANVWRVAKRARSIFGDFVDSLLDDPQNQGGCRRCATSGCCGDNGSAFFSCLHSPAKSAMAEILVSDLCECRPPLSSAGVFMWAAMDHTRPSQRLFPTVPIALRIVFFHCLPLFLRRRHFSSPRKALHCNWCAFSIADRLYFSRKIFRVGVWPDCTLSVRHETRDSIATGSGLHPSCETRNERLRAPAWPGVRKPPYAIALP